MVRLISGIYWVLKIELASANNQQNFPPTILSKNHFCVKLHIDIPTPPSGPRGGGYLSILGYLYKWWDLEWVKHKELNYTVTTHQAVPYTSNGKDVEL